MLKNRYWTEYYWFIEWLCTSELGEIVRLYCIGIKQTRDMKLVLKKTQWTSLPSLWECVFLYFVQTLFKLHNWHLVFSNILKLCVFRGENFFKLQRNDTQINVCTPWMLSSNLISIVFFPNILILLSDWNIIFVTYLWSFFLLRLIYYSIIWLYFKLY